MSDPDKTIKFASAREKFLSLSLGSTRKSYYPQLKEHLELAKENERRLRLLIDNLPARIAYVDAQQRYVIANQAHEKILGRASDQIVGKTVASVLGRENYLKIKQNILDALKGNHVRYETAFTGMKGEFQWVEVHYVPDVHPLQGVVGFYDLTLDLTEKKLAEKALKKSEDLFRLITGYTSSLVSIHNKDGDYLYVSPSFERLGYTQEELIGTSGFSVVVKEDIEAMLASLEKGKQGKISKAVLEYRLRDKKGGIHHYRGAFDAVFNTDGFLEKIICVAEDISELRQAQAERLKALTLAAETNKQALVGQIAGKMAHDFNNILGIIMGNTELSLLDCKEGDVKKALELIFEQTIRGKNLTRNLVAFAKDQEPKQNFFKINEKIDLVLNLMRKDLEGIALIRDDDAGVPELLADPGMIEHALVNLIQNSIHATSQTPDPRLTLRTYCAEDQICFEIEDNGCGIPGEHLEHIYTPFFTLKGSNDLTNAYEASVKGTGYGMSNVKKYIEQHRGSISVESQVNQGTKFTVRMPVVQKELTRQEKIQVQKQSLHFGKYILLVEDETAISDVQYRVLTDEPCRHKVDIAQNGQVAMDLLDRHTYDLVSLDYVLPGKITGIDVYHHIRSTHKTIPILFVSGNIEFLESLKELKQKDVHIDHLSKPCQNVDYVRRINDLFLNDPA